MKLITNLFLIALMCIACTEVEEELSPEELAGVTVCGKSDPVNELPWLRERIDRHLKIDPSLINPPSPFIVTAYKYEGKIIIADESLFYSSPYLAIYNCDGSLAFGPEWNSYNKFIAERKLLRVLYEYKR